MGASTASAASFAPVIATPNAPRPEPRADGVEIVLGNGRRMKAEHTMLDAIESLASDD